VPKSGRPSTSVSGFTMPGVASLTPPPSPARRTPAASRSRKPPREATSPRSRCRGPSGGSSTTRAEHAIKRHVDLVLDQLDQGLREVGEIVAPGTGGVPLAFLHTFGTWLAPAVLSGFLGEPPVPASNCGSTARPGSRRNTADVVITSGDPGRTGPGCSSSRCGSRGAAGCASPTSRTTRSSSCERGPTPGTDRCGRCARHRPRLGDGPGILPPLSETFRRHVLAAAPRPAPADLDCPQGTM